MQERVSSDARSISDKTAAAVNSCRLTRPPPVITLESLWLCTLPRYYCQSIKTKAPGIRRRIGLYTWERDLREGILSTASVSPPRIRTDSSTTPKSQQVGLSVCQGFDRLVPPVVTSGVRNPRKVSRSLLSLPLPSTAAWCPSPCVRILPAPELSSGTSALSCTAGGGGGCGWQTASPGSTSSRTAPRCSPWTDRARLRQI